MQLGQPDVPALAGNKVQAPPRSPRGRTPGSKPHPIPLAAHGPDRLFTDPAPAELSRERGSTQLLACAPGPFSTRGGRLWWLLLLSALGFSRDYGLFAPRETAPILVKSGTQKQKLGQAGLISFRVQAWVKDSIEFEWCFLPRCELGTRGRKTL